MASKKLPSIQFYPGDWRKDPGVQSLDFESRGIWFEILLVMFESEDRGKLVLNGQPMSDDSLANILGISEAKLQQTLSKLIANGVAKCEQNSGIIYCRKMVEDERLRQIRAEAGSEGGKQSASKRQANAKQNPTPSSSSSSSSSSSTGASAPDPPLPPSGEPPGDEDFRSELEFVAAWNATQGVRRCLGDMLTEKRRRAFRQRIRDPEWEWWAALAKFPLKVTQGRPDGWKPDIEWFLRPDSVTKILEGKYDWRTSETERGRQATHDPDRPIADI